MGAYEKALLKKKYGWSGEKYADLMGKIVKENQSKIANRVLESDKKRLSNNLKRIAPKRDFQKVKLPDVSNIIRRSPTILKAADQGQLLMETVRDRIRKDVKQSMLEHGINNKSGKINKNIARTLRKKLNDTFDGYTKKDPKFNKPTNVETIAVTETNSVANSVRHEYAKQAADSAKDSGFVMVKEWVHNGSRKGNPREGHEELDGVQVPLDGTFTIDDEKEKKSYEVQRPYDASLPASQVINCHCEIVYRWIREKND